MFGSNSHFKPGRSVFTCGCCDRQTRDVGNGGTDLCGLCYQLCGLDNMVNDGHSTWEQVREEAESLLKQVERKGGNVGTVRANCTFLKFDRPVVVDQFDMREQEQEQLQTSRAVKPSEAPLSSDPEAEVNWFAVMKDGSTLCFSAPADRKLAKGRLRGYDRGAYSSLKRVR